jgi:hypothetical protein
VGDDDDLRINTLHRFAKQSPQLVLQEYSHCEVPAGCGGVVLRWHDPAAGAPAFVRVLVVDATVEVWLDGVELVTSWVQLTAGEHVLAARVPASSSPQPRVAMIGAGFDADQDVDLLALARWQVTTTPPPATWTCAEFAHAWPDAPPAPPALLASVDQAHRHAIQSGIRRGQALYELPAEACWLRVAFVVVHPGPVAPR